MLEDLDVPRLSHDRQMLLTQKFISRIEDEKLTNCIILDLKCRLKEDGLLRVVEYESFKHILLDSNEFHVKNPKLCIRNGGIFDNMYNQMYRSNHQNFGLFMEMKKMTQRLDEIAKNYLEYFNKENTSHIETITGWIRRSAIG